VLVKAQVPAQAQVRVQERALSLEQIPALALALVLEQVLAQEDLLSQE
jgi:hypothetical protein